MYRAKNCSKKPTHMLWARVWAFFHSNISRYGFFYFSFTIVCLIPFLNTFKPMRSNIASDDLQNYHNFKYINIYVVISTHLRTVESKVQMQKRLRLDHWAVIWLSLPTCLHFQPIGDEIDLSWQVDTLKHVPLQHARSKVINVPILNLRTGMQLRIRLHLRTMCSSTHRFLTVILPVLIQVVFEIVLVVDGFISFWKYTSRRWAF